MKSDLSTNPVIAPKYTLNASDIQKWVHNLILFLAPVAIIYLTSIIGLIQQTGHIIMLKDFIPNQFATGAMILYILNGLLDIIRKFTDGPPKEVTV